MSNGNSKSKSAGKSSKSAPSKRQELEEIERLSSICSQEIDTAKLKFFSELPLSERTKSGLIQSNFVEMTDIQRMSIGKSLAGLDILGAAKTGSGKTLAFLLPVVECLYRQKWSAMDGLGALIISPTRELALQIFEVLRKIGKNHTLSAGLIIGGKDWKYEKDRINRMNILVCTPGRLLQHMDQTPDFNCDNLQVLVLDEADRILDMGFKKTLNAIIENLPPQRQTLLFSATQTKSISDLARLSLKDPEYVSVHEKAATSTPDSLTQNYLVCQLYEKLDLLFSFIKTHLQSKCLVFLSSCKQVRFVYETFCKLQPGTIVMCLHGKQKQVKRNFMFDKFCKAKSAVMICTDIAARGLDFPAVDWVIQADCPEDGESYIHRVGRTARFKSNGRALLFLLPSEEEGMNSVFEKKKIPISKIAVNPSKTNSIIPKLQSLCAESPELKYLAEKSFICYLRSIWLQKDKGVFNISEMPIEEYASSLGLPGAPNIKFVRKFKNEKNRYRNMANAEKKAMEAVKESGDEDDEDQYEERRPGMPGTKTTKSNSSDDSDDGEETLASSKKPVTRVDKMFAKKNQSVLWEHSEKLKTRDEDAQSGNESEDNLLTLVRKNHDIDGVPADAPGFPDRPLSVRDLRKQKKKFKIKEESHGVKLVYDDDGKPQLSWKLETEQEFAADDEDVFMKHKKYLDAASEIMKQADTKDKQVQKERLREKKMLKKRKLKQATEDEEPVAILGENEQSDEYQSETSNRSAPMKKRQKSWEDSADESDGNDLDVANIVNEEEFALKLLHNRTA